MCLLFSLLCPSVPVCALCRRASTPRRVRIALVDLGMPALPPLPHPCLTHHTCHSLFLASHTTSPSRSCPCPKPPHSPPSTGSTAPAVFRSVFRSISQGAHAPAPRHAMRACLCMCGVVLAVIPCVCRCSSVRCAWRVLRGAPGRCWRGSRSSAGGAAARCMCLHSVYSMWHEPRKRWGEHRPVSANVRVGRARVAYGTLARLERALCRMGVKQRHGHSRVSGVCRGDVQHTWLG